MKYSVFKDDIDAPDLYFFSNDRKLADAQRTLQAFLRQTAG